MIVEQVAIEDRQTALLKVPRKTRWTRKHSILIVVLLFLLFASSISALVGYLEFNAYQTDFSLAQTGMQHLRSAITLLESLQEQPLATQTVERAQQEFAQALSDTQALQVKLANFPDMSDVVPVFGSRLVAAIHLSSLAVHVSQAGLSGCKILELVLTRIGSPLKTSTPGLTDADFTTVSTEFQTLRVSLNAAMNEDALVRPEDVSFDAHLSKLMQAFQTKIPLIRNIVTQAGQVLPILPVLLGNNTPAHYLLEIMDSTELRPGGGFIGNYGIATISGGRFTTAQITDTYLLDRPFELAGHSIPFPSSYQWFAHYLNLSSWSLRDSNLDADFTTDARNGELNYQREGGSVPLQGVIAITPYFIENVLNITGPISMPEYHEMVTAQNLISLIHYHQLGEIATRGGTDLNPSPDGYSSQRKQFTELLAKRLLARVQQFSSGNVAKFLQLAVSSLHTKDIQMYLNASNAENTLQFLHLDGSIQSPPGDHLFIVDANVAGGKTNNFIINTVHEQVIIGEQGKTVHHTTISYSWALAGQNYGNQLYHDYVRIYVPTDSTLSKQDGWQPLGISTAFGSQVWAGYITLVYGQTRTITLVWASHSESKNGANGWHYQYLLQRQAGIQRTLELQVMLPSCSTMTKNWGGLVANSKQEESLNKSFTQDLNVGVDFTC